jgi:hypothetical protein
VASELDSRRRALEEKFFQREKTLQLRKLQTEVERREAAEALGKASGVTSMAVLEHLVTIGISVDTMIALSLIPLIEVAWADGEMQDAERDAILRAAEKEGVEAKSPAFDLLKGWLKRKPTKDLLEVWIAYVQALTAELTEGDRQALKAEVMGRAWQVADAAGGFLGLGNRISDEESKMLARLDRAVAVSCRL